MINDNKIESILINWTKNKSDISQKITETLKDTVKELGNVFEIIYDKEKVMELLSSDKITFYYKQDDNLARDWRAFVYNSQNGLGRTISDAINPPKVDSALPYICNPFDIDDSFIRNNQVTCRKLIENRKRLKSLILELARELQDIRSILADENITIEHIKKYSPKLCQ